MDIAKKNIKQTNRSIDLVFCRAMQEGVSTLSDDALMEQLVEKSSDPNQFLNPTEFLACVASKNILPAKFDSRGYIISSPDLWHLRQDWEAVVHYLKCGRQEGRQYTIEFDPIFYRELYHAGKLTDDSQLETEWRAAGHSRYGNAAEMVWASGFKDSGWIGKFDIQSYMVANNLLDKVENGLQALAHFLTIGIDNLLPPSTKIEFDPNFQRLAQGASEQLSDAEIYRWWLETGLPADKPASERHYLEQLGLSLNEIPDGFMWHRYLADRPDIAESCQDRWQGFAHFVEYGVLESNPLPLTEACVVDTLLAIADRLAGLKCFDRASRVYERILLLAICADEHQINRAKHHAADNALQMEQHARALSLYQQVIASGNAVYWTYCNAIKAACALGEFEIAARIIDEALSKFPRNQRLLDFHRDVRTCILDLAINRYVAALKAGDQTVPPIEAEIKSVYQDCEGAYIRQFGPLPEISPRVGAPFAGRKLRVVMLANEDLSQCTYYRVNQKKEQFAEGGVDFQSFPRDKIAEFRSALSTADIAIFYRLAASFDILDCLAYSRALGVPRYFEIDDLIFDPVEFPEPLEAYEGALTEEQHFELRAGVLLVRGVAALCDSGIASTNCLASHLQRLVSGDVIVHRNGLSDRLMKIAKSSNKSTGDITKNLVTLFYGSGTKAHGRDFQEIVLPALLRLMAENPRIRFHACGHVDITQLTLRFPDRVAHVDTLLDREAYTWLLSRADVNLSIITPNNFNDAKSEIKWLEAAAFGIPSVVSNVKGFTETLTNGTDVILVSPEPAAWYSTLAALVCEPARLHAVGEAARARALALYTPSILGRHLEATFRGMMPAKNQAARNQSSKESQPRRPRLLVVNVFYPPQAIGGATRVVHDEIRSLRQAKPGWDIIVLCGNDEPAPPYELSSYWSADVRVFSISTMPREHMDWHPFDEQVRPLAEKVLDAVEPDLVHFHATQRLGVGVVEAVRDRQIPYVVTAHDAWWISDHQFLMDHTDRLRFPWMQETYGTSSNPHSLSSSISRRFLLMSCLEQAAKVLAVSASFAEIYNRSGVQRVAVVENALSHLPPIEPAPRLKSGKVRLGHFGGMTYHKGFFLLKSVLTSGRYNNLDLLLVDNGAPYSDVRRERWGNTDVTIIGKVKQDRIGWLYGQIDVLVAPSMWPESFGLVTREALGYGKWIVAGNRGAVGEPVISGVNGFVVDVTQSEETYHDSLPAVLRLIDREPDRYRVSPKQMATMVSLTEHTALLATIYAEAAPTMANSTVTAKTLA